VTVEAMKFSSIRTIAIIAEGIPENLTRKLIVEAREKNVTIIGKEHSLSRSRLCFIDFFLILL
jgi:succinyl-CoA synthetase alpha subunit